MRKKPHPEYNVWAGMKSRCQNPQNKAYHYYGGRGIRVCRGFQTFSSFLKIMGCRPSPSLSIDRINNNGNYSCGSCSECLANGWPMNCRWATRVVQMNNTRGNRIIAAFGRTQTLAQWSAETGIDYKTITSRIDDAGVTPDEALSLAPRPLRQELLTLHGVPMTIDEMAASAGMKPITISKRLERGMSPEQAVAKPVHRHMVMFRGSSITLAELSRLSGIKRVTLFQRLSRGMTAEEAIAFPVFIGRPPRQKPPANSTTTQQIEK